MDLEYIIQNPGLEYITEMILFNLDFEDLKKCQNLNKSIKKTLEDPMFWLRKWRTQRWISKKNYNDWVEAFKLTKNTNVDANVRLYYYYSRTMPSVIFVARKNYVRRKSCLMQELYKKNHSKMKSCYIRFFIRNLYIKLCYEKFYE